MAGTNNVLSLSSRAFSQNSRIPEKYTCDGENVNPPLRIENTHSDAQSLALIMDDPDAPKGTFVHWILWNIHPQTTEIGENAIPEKAEQGYNNFGKHSYGGPCPPSGSHRYFFKLYALDTRLNLGPQTMKDDLVKAMEGHIIDATELIGLYR